MDLGQQRAAPVKSHIITQHNELPPWHGAAPTRTQKGNGDLDINDSQHQVQYRHYLFSARGTTDVLRQTRSLGGIMIEWRSGDKNLPNPG
jgi:hypothetical protein